MADDQVKTPTPVSLESGENVAMQQPRTGTPVPSSSVATNTADKSPHLEVKSKRSAESRRSIAYNRLKGGYVRSSKKEYLQSLSKMEIKVSLEIMIAEWGKFLEAHYELAELATTHEAEKVNAFALYAATRELLEERLEYLDANPREAFGKDFHFNEKGEMSTSISPSVHTIDESVGNDHSTPKRPITKKPPMAPRGPKETAKFDIPMIFGDEKGNVEHCSSPDSNDHWNATFNLKLEPIRIPQFDGDKENWVLFRDQFLALVHNNARMNEAIKMHQLFTHLGEKALRVIKGITPAGSNYERAWKTVNERFNNNQMLINHHLGRFLKLPTLSKDEPTKLTILVDGVNELINSLPGLNEPMTNWDAILIFCIFNKLDKPSQEAWKIHQKIHTKPTLQEFIEFLDQRAQSEDTVHSTLLNSGMKPTVIKSEPKRFQKRSSVFYVEENKDRSCKLCKENHPLFRCLKFRNMPVKERWLKARDVKVCLKCLGNHGKEECKFNQCPVCNGKHNRLLCYEDKKRRNEKKSESPIETQIKEANINHVYLDDDIATILGTAEIRVHNTISELKELRCLCDNGSQLNLITEEAVRRFGLTKTRAKIQLNGVGGKLSDHSNGIVKLRFGPNFNRENSLEALFFVVRRISNPLPNTHIKTDW